MLTLSLGLAWGADAPAWSLVGIPETDGLGSRLTVGDFNGDGLPDLLTGSKRFDGSAGRAWLFLGDGTSFATPAVGTWDGEALAVQLGYAVAALGDVDGDGLDDAAIDAYGIDDFTGRIYIFAGDVAGLEASAATTLDGGDYGIGRKLAGPGDIDGDGYADLLAGASGAVTAFHGSSVGLETTPWQELRGVGGYANTFAAGSDIDGDGRPDVAVADRSDDGSVHLYRGTAAGLEVFMTLTNRELGDTFGEEVGMGGDVDGDGYDDVLVAGTEGFGLFRGSDAGVDNSPAAFVMAEGKLDFSNVLTIVGDVDGDGRDDIGAGSTLLNQATVFLGTMDGFDPDAIGLAGGSDLGASLVGADVDADGWMDVIVGAPGDLEGAGSVGLYAGATGGPASAATDQVKGDAGDQVGTSAAGGDIDGDGIADLMVMVPGGQGGVGELRMWRGAVGGPATDPTWLAVSTKARLGGTATIAGDLDGDSYADVALENADTLDIHPGSASGPAEEASLTLGWGSGWGGPGRGLAAAGDVNGDGFGDLLVGLVRGDRFDLFLGGPDGVPAEAQVTVLDRYATHTAGHSLAGAGDVDGDGYDDVVSGGYVHSSTGRAWWFGGAPEGLRTDDEVELLPAGDRDDLDYDVDGAGDIDGDGYADVVVGVPWDLSADPGMVWIFVGSSAGPMWAGKVEGTESGALFGDTVAGVGDLDVDGFDDVAVGAPGAGYAYVFAGSAGGLVAEPVRSIAVASDAITIEAIGDVNGDGAADLFVGAPNTDHEAGRADVWLSAYDADGDGSIGGVDCDDGNPAVHPGAHEVCDELPLDEDCDGVANEGDADGSSTWYPDADGDGYGDASAPHQACAQPPGWVATGDDCDDTDSNVHPAADEAVGDGVDEDCDGFELCPADSDGDGCAGLGVEATVDLRCGARGCAADCDDDNPDVHPGADEVAGDGVDQDCDGIDTPATVIPADGCGCSAHASPGATGSAAALGLAALLVLARRRITEVRPVQQVA